MTDYRAMCAELVNELHAYKVAHPNHDTDVIDRARAALAEPEAKGPSASDVTELFYRHMGEGSEVGFENAIAEALARWGRPAAAPVPEPGEVEGIAEWLNIRGRMADLGTRDWYFRAATLLQQQAVPVPVSERLPGPEDCDAEGRCWRYIDPEESMGNPMWELARSKYAGATYGSVAWLAAHAIPLLQTEQETTSICYSNTPLYDYHA